MDTGSLSSASTSALRPCSSRTPPKSVFVDEEDDREVEYEVTSSPVPESDVFANAREGKGLMDGGLIGRAKGGVFKRRKGNGGVPSSSSAPFSYSRGKRGVALGRRRKETNLGTGCCGDSDFEELALPLGMSLAAIIAQVVELKNVDAVRIPVEHLSQTCISAMKESVANIYGKKFDNFLKNFEKSFGSTLKTLRVISQGNIADGVGDRKPVSSLPMSSHFETQPYQGDPEAQSLLEASETQSSQGDVMSHNEGKLPVPPFFVEDSETQSFQDAPKTRFSQGDETLNTEIEEIRGNHQSLNPGNSQIALPHEQQVCQQLANISHSRDGSRSSESILTTFEKMASEQTRSNNLKSIEIELTLKRLQLKQSQLNHTSHSNFLERIKISMGASKARFKEEKLKNQMQDFRHAELVKRCIDYLVAGLLIMSVCLGYGTWVYSYKRITEATLSCNSYTKEATSWWVPKPMASFNSSWQMLRCHVMALSRMSFGLLLILAIAYSLFQRSASPVMPVTFILLLLGVICGFAGKLCIDTLGGSGYWWLIHWEVLCLLHFFVNAFPSVIYQHLYGPVLIECCHLPHRIRRFMFYNILVLILPVCSGLIPFASFNDWIRHFIDLVFHPRED